VPGRVLDVTPAVARKLHFEHKGNSTVEIKPIVAPQPDGRLKRTADSR
jgi:rare lipoprotein A (peptidoglycan hydrolase)